jgi:hypothetical protein
MWNAAVLQATVSDQRHDAAGVDDCRSVKESMAGGIVFNGIKPHSRIKKFLGTSENAVKTQIWCAVSTYGLIAIVKKELHIKVWFLMAQHLKSGSEAICNKTFIRCQLPAVPDNHVPRGSPARAASRVTLDHDLALAVGRRPRNHPGTLPALQLGKPTSTV